MPSILVLTVGFFPMSKLEEVVILYLLSERRVPIKVCGICGVLFQQEPTMSSVSGLVFLLYIFVSKELDVDVFVGIRVYNPISPIFWIVIPVGVI